MIQVALFFWKKALRLASRLRISWQIYLISQYHMHLYKTSSFNLRDISGSIYYFSVRPTWLLDKEFFDETFNEA